jgi:CIC family chloride channel protein
MSRTNGMSLVDSIIDRPHLRLVGRGIVLAALVGVVAGLGAVVFHLLSQGVAHVALKMLAGYDAGGPAHEKELIGHLLGEGRARLIPWLLVLVPTVGGLLSGVIVYWFAPEAEGHGTDSVIDAYHNRRGLIRARVPLVKMIASAITLGTGGSGGREGPIAQIGAGFGSFLANRLKLSDAERRVLLAAGIGAGIGAIFRAPLAGAMFAIEVLYRDPDFEAEALIPAFISTAVAYCVFGLSLGADTFGPLFAVAPGVSFTDPAQLLPLAVLALAMALASFGYCKCFYGMTALFARMRLPRMFRPAIGAMLTGCVALVVYYGLGGLRFFQGAAPADGLGVLSYGYGFLQKILNPVEGAAALTIGLLLVVGIGKILTTSLTIGSGGSGGVFGPSMVIGGSLGAVVGMLLHRWMPGLVPADDVVIFAILGMAAFFAAAANTPVSTLIMVSELTGSYELLLPAMWVCALAYIISRRWTIYAKQVPNRIESPAHRGDFIVDILEGMTVRNAFTQANRHFITIPIEMPLREVVQVITDTRQTSFPVLDHDQRYYGLFSLNDIRKFLYDSDLGDIAVAHDLAAAITPVMLTTDLGEVVARFAQTPYDELPVVDPDDHVVGVVTDRDICMGIGMRDVKPSELRISDIASGTVFSCKPDDEIPAALELMKEHRVRRLVVVDDAGRLAGVVSLNDIVLTAQLDEHPAERSQEIFEALRSICEHREPTIASV